MNKYVRYKLHTITEKLENSKNHRYEITRQPGSKYRWGLLGFCYPSIAVAQEWIDVNEPQGGYEIYGK